MRVFLTHAPDALENQFGYRALLALREMVEVGINSTGRVLDAEELASQAAGFDVVLTDRATAAPAAFFEGTPDLLALLRCAVDVRNVDLNAASRHGVLVTHATPGFAPAVAELALGFMVDLARGLSEHASAYRLGHPPARRMGRQLADASLGVLGYGEIGRYLARLGRTLGMKVQVNDPYTQIQEPDIHQSDFAPLLTSSDFVVCVAVASPETENLMDAAAFARMRADAFFINLARGELVDESALAAALDDGAIAGAAMDVGRAPDQMPSPELARRPNVLATPHIGGATLPAVEHQAFDTVAQLRALLSGRIPLHALNSDAATRLARIRSET